ncbi:hypothetical protein DB32_003659 [Sandaracinus amylolyticus]|uniref:Uncharacterized protein n=1 Tax=Sandaracinus amylolyticus TaxID=927083 RepID=A0A0F6YJ38_9BACT|nr:hypothetical protein DB32_003659 [Sandaracinus amylolyticus]
MRAPILDAPSTVALAVKLLARVPAPRDARDRDALARVRSKARTLRAAVLELQRAWAARDDAERREKGRTKVRPLDLASDAAWASLLARLEAWSGIGAEARAAELMALLLPTRLDFTRLALPAQWAVQQQKLDLVEAEGLARDLERLAGAAFLRAVRDTHEALGVALGMRGDAPPEPPIADVLQAMRAVHRAIGAYALRLADVYDDVSDEAAAAIRMALAPIAEARAAAATRPPSEAGEAGGPDTPVPDVDDA